MTGILFYFSKTDFNSLQNYKQKKYKNYFQNSNFDYIQKIYIKKKLQKSKKTKYQDQTRGEFVL